VGEPAARSDRGAAGHSRRDRAGALRHGVPGRVRLGAARALARVGAVHRARRGTFGLRARDRPRAGERDGSVCREELTMTMLRRNGRLVNEGRIEEADLLIEGERIARIGPGPAPAGGQVLDLDGRYVLPGLIDDQVHFREPGHPAKGTIEAERRAAVPGGVTSFLDMPNNSPPAVTLAAIAEKRASAARTSYANYGFYLGATNTNLDEIRRASAAEVCGIKVFMGASTGNLLVDDSA